ncbi:MAG: hybrid sensor histidine kinase/response regulator [Leptospirales bacterium]|nr:hybrid sensor histidine kinase/response regulator [Leptospirales bacterium]
MSADVIHRLPSISCLYVEDDPDVRKQVHLFLKDYIGTVYLAEDGAEGLASFKENNPDLIITDIRMPELTGIEMIKQIKATKKSQRIIVTSAYDDSEYLIPLIESGVDRFVMKPLSVHALLEQILQVSNMILSERDEEEKNRTASERLRSQIEWLMYKDNRIRFSDISSEVNAIYNLKRSLNEAAGFGAMISIVNMIRSFAKETEGKYLVKKDLMDLLFENNGYCARLVEGLDRIESILKGKVVRETIAIRDLIQKLVEHTSSLTAFLEKKGRSLHISLPETTRKVEVDSSQIILALEEMIINAAKYGEGHDIDVYGTIGSGYLSIHVRNTSPKEERLRFPSHAERLVLEPFFRLRPTIEGYSEVEKLPIGLGLSIVNYIAQKHGGFFSISNAQDHLKQPPVDCVVARLQIPAV